jgi:aminoglycoside 3-N-acetyltransferase
MHSRSDLADGFRRLGVAAGDVVMLHASVRAVGTVAGGPVEILLALDETLAPDGTLLMYASCPQYYDEVGRGNLTPAQEQELLEKLPAFDPLTAPSQRENGALVEFCRTLPGSVVSDHVARFVARGRHADRLVSPQPWDYAFGAGSALERFAQAGGRILLLGADHDNVTFLHYAEHIVDIPGKRIARFQVPWRDGHGGRVWREMAEVDTAEAAHASWPDRFFAQIVDGHLAQTGNTGVRVGDAQAFLIDARGLLAHALAAMVTRAGEA